MTRLGAGMFVVGSVVALVVAIRLEGARRPWAHNHRGERLAVVLGIAIVAGMAAADFAAVLADALFGKGSVQLIQDSTLAILAAVFAVFGAGLFDDYRHGRPRGLVEHARALFRGHLSTGIVKLFAALAAGTLVGAAIGLRGAHLLLAVGVMAGSANLWNLLDVVPGRAVKFYLPAIVPLVLRHPTSGFALLSVAVTGGVVSVSWFDLRERAMLGDAGSNVLGFLVGIGLVGELTQAGLVVALAAILFLHLLAETVTLSAVIWAVPPLRWLDLAGRPRHPVLAEGSPPAEGSDSMKSRGA